MAVHAQPVPLDPYNPAGDEHDQLRHPSPFVPIRLPVFTPVVWLNDLIIRIISVIGSFGGAPTRGNSSVTNLPKPRHSRVLSESAESVEEGENIAMDTLRPTPAVSMGQGPRVVSTRVRVTRGGDRRKFD